MGIPIFLNTRNDGIKGKTNIHHTIATIPKANRKTENRDKIDTYSTHIYDCSLGFVTRLTRRVPLVEQKLFTLPEHLRSPPAFSGVRSLVLLCMFCRSLFVFLYFFFLAIVLSVPLQSTVSDCPFVIFKLFFLTWDYIL